MAIWWGLWGWASEGRAGDASEGKGPQRRLDRRLEGLAEAVGGACRGGWGRLLSVTNAIGPGTCRQGDSGWL